MASIKSASDRIADEDYDLELDADVVVIGGSLAGSWAALAAIEQGASVVVVDKGYVGSSGPIAAGSVGAYYAKPDDPVQRDAMVNARMPLAFGLADSRWGERILTQSYRSLEQMAQWGYQWPRVSNGKEKRGVINPNVLAFLRRQLERLNATLLDNSPALELVTSEGVVSGVAGVRRRTGETFLVRAGAVVVATGGTAFLSQLAGAGGNTGDGYLLAAEVGAEFSGMEFSSQYHIRPYGGTLTKGAYRGGDGGGGWGQLSDNDGNPVNLGRGTVNAILNTGACWDTFASIQDPEMQKLVLQSSYGTTQWFQDAGVNPFTGKYRVDFVLEGSIRATGGIAINDDLQTNIPGLFAGGDVASREKVNGAGPPGGGPAAGWAIGAGYFSGQSAARYAQKLGVSKHARKAVPAGGAGLRPTGTRRAIDLKAAIGKVQAHMHALDKNYYREEKSLASSLETFAGVWKELRQGLTGAPADDARGSVRAAMRARETAALVAAARWMNISALERRETRGLHRRSDFPALDPQQTHHLISGGLDEVWVKAKPVDPDAVYPGKGEPFKQFVHPTPKALPATPAPVKEAVAA